jgi:hypothetical protein
MQSCSKRGAFVRRSWSGAGPAAPENAWFAARIPGGPGSTANTGTMTGHAAASGQKTPPWSAERRRRTRSQGCVPRDIVALDATSSLPDRTRGASPTRLRRKPIASAFAECVLAVPGDRVMGGNRAGRVALVRPASIVALSSAKGTRCVLAQNRGCPRNCRRRALLDGPLDDAPGRSRRALSREPGDLPATRLVPALGWRAYGE